MLVAPVAPVVHSAAAEALHLARTAPQGKLADCTDCDLLSGQQQFNCSDKENLDAWLQATWHDREFRT